MNKKQSLWHIAAIIVFVGCALIACDNGTTSAVVVPTFTVSYDGNGNTGGTAPVDPGSPYASGSTVTVLGKADLAKTGYSFTGWNTDAGAAGDDYDVDDTFVIDADTVLYAQWHEDGIALSENGNELSGDTFTFTAEAFNYAEQAAQTITVTNTGAEATGLLTVALSGAGFTLSAPSLTSIAAGAIDIFTIRPNTGLNAGTHTAIVTVSGGDASASFTVSFTVHQAIGSFGTPGGIDTTYTTTLTLADLTSQLAAGYAWDDSTTSLNAGDNQLFPATYTDPSNNYLPADGEITVSVAQAVGSFGSPAAIPATFSPTLTLADLTAQLAAGYAWDDDTIAITDAGDGQEFSARYIDPSNNYLPADGDIVVNVALAVGSFGSPAAIGTTYTTTLTLADLTAQLAAGYAWDDDTTSLNAGDGQEFPATYTDPSNNYLPASGDITVNVAQAAGVFGSPAAIGTTYTATLTLADLTAQLAAGYAWDDDTTSLNAGNGQEFPATFTDPSNNYLPASGDITVNVAQAAGEAVSPLLASKTSDNITLETIIASTGQTVGYGIADADDADEAAWQTTPIFNGRAPATTYYLFVRAVGCPNHEDRLSDSLAVTTQASETFAISFAQLQDEAPDLPAVNIRLIGGASETTKPITVNGTYDRITYFFNGSPITGDAIEGLNGETLTVSPGFFNNSTGTFYITVEVETGGRRYSKIITITVRL